MSQKPTEYQFNRLVFGINSSPFVAQLVSQHHAKVYEKQYPRTAEIILRSMYMDDSMDSVSSEMEGIKLYKELSELRRHAYSQMVVKFFKGRRVFLHRTGHLK